MKVIHVLSCGLCVVHALPCWAAFVLVARAVVHICASLMLSDFASRLAPSFFSFFNVFLVYVFYLLFGVLFLFYIVCCFILCFYYVFCFLFFICAVFLSFSFFYFSIFYVFPVAWHRVCSFVSPCKLPSIE